MNLLIVVFACNDVSLPEAEVPRLQQPIRKVKYADFNGYVQQPFGKTQQKQLVLVPSKITPAHCALNPENTILLYTNEENKPLAVNYLAKIHPELPIIEPTICRDSL